MLIDDIRTVTRPIHEQVDGWLMPKIEAVNTKERYALLLKTFYGYFNPVLQLVDKYRDQAYLADYAERRKPSLILNDLVDLNLPAGDIKMSTSLPVVENAAQAFGALYVLEGSTLGGIYLAKALAKNLHITDMKGLSFFYGYGKASRENWTRFVEELNAFGEKKGTGEEVIKAAGDTFTCFKKHLEDQITF